MRIIEALEIIADLMQVFADGYFLVGWARPDVGKAARREEDAHLWGDIPCRSYRCYVRTGGGELRLEFQGVLPVVGDAVVSGS
jgi:hypothetical protein